jgi:hypothetical protein
VRYGLKVCERHGGGAFKAAQRKAKGLPAKPVRSLWVHHLHAHDWQGLESLALWRSAQLTWQMRQRLRLAYLARHDAPDLWRAMVRRAQAEANGET